MMLYEAEVALVVAGGSPGSGTRLCTFRYDVYVDGDKLIARNADPARLCYERVLGRACRPATEGKAVFLNDELFGLLPYDESPDDAVAHH